MCHQHAPELPGDSGEDAGALLPLSALSSLRGAGGAVSAQGGAVSAQGGAVSAQGGAVCSAVQAAQRDRGGSAAREPRRHRGEGAQPPEPAG